MSTEANPCSHDHSGYLLLRGMLTPGVHSSLGSTLRIDH